MPVVVDCACGARYEVDPVEVSEFECERCKRKLAVPAGGDAERISRLRNRMRQGEPGMREAMREAATLKAPAAIALLREGAESGMREAVNTALCGLADYDGPGTDLLAQWIGEGRLTVSRLTAAMREQKFAGGVGMLCRFMADGRLKESQLAEAVAFLADSNDVKALEALSAARRNYPNLAGILDQALAGMRHLDASAGGVPDAAKRIPGSTEAAPLPAKKGCMGMVLLLALVLAVLGGLAGWVL
ncbi:MAG: hypothetical protein IT463_00145 [Planctomycetes bacterium]|nr:hypothetical protein [Planctomycetota bacterium]